MQHIGIIAAIAVGVIVFIIGLSVHVLRSLHREDENMHFDPQLVRIDEDNES